MPTQPHVLIVGAGVGGLTLAHGLAKHGIKVTVFEKEYAPRKPIYFSEGYRFRMNPYGSAAVKSLLPESLFAQFEQTAAITRIGGTKMKYDGTVLQSQEGHGGFLGGLGPVRGIPIPKPGVPTEPSKPGQYGVYTVDRTLFRALLLQNIDVQFGKQVDRYSLDSPAKKVSVHFSDGSSATGDFLVGADGLRSVIRKQLLPQHIPVDTTGRCIYGKTPITPKLLESFPKELHNWMSLTIDDTGLKPLSLLTEPLYFSDEAKALSTNVLPNASEDYIYWVLSGTPDTFELPDSQFLDLSPEQTVQHSLKITEKWSPAIRTVLELQTVEQAAPLRISSVVPQLPYWEPSSLVTLLGDSVHVMSPTGGVGANTALRDSSALCEVLRKAFIENKGSVSAEAIGTYEADMRVYASEAVDRSQQGGAKIYGQPPFEECKPVDWL
ncbi:2-polyprenyl-6-methoxyphenol hydroxylase [Lentinula novae-zelandiae]|nr:2-polyprenyl-6-methoxyphenol hydroxylase [Lentinula novae-zelandiae]